MKKYALAVALGILTAAGIVIAAPGASPWTQQYLQFDNANDQTFRGAVNLTATGSLSDAGAPFNVAGNLATLGGDPILASQGATDGGLWVATISYGRAVCSSSAATLTYNTTFAEVPMCSCLSLGTHICTGGTITSSSAGFVCTTGEVLHLMCIGAR